MVAHWFAEEEKKRIKIIHCGQLREINGKPA